MLPDGTKKMGLWEDGKRMKWIEGEENVIIKPQNWDEFSKCFLIYPRNSIN